jgi:ABC-type multidrug transport system fused ATPase/permease subunit
MAGIIYYGCILYEAGEVTIGNISSFLLYMIFLIFDFALLAMVAGNVYQTIGASEKIVKLMRYIP